jgi:hypothetical protein
MFVSHLSSISSACAVSHTNNGTARHIWTNRNIIAHFVSFWISSDENTVLFPSTRRLGIVSYASLLSLATVLLTGSAHSDSSGPFVRIVFVVALSRRLRFRSFLTMRTNFRLRVMRNVCLPNASFDDVRFRTMNEVWVGNKSISSISMYNGQIPTSGTVVLSQNKIQLSTQPE